MNMHVRQSLSLSLSVQRQRHVAVYAYRVRERHTDEKIDRWKHADMVLCLYATLNPKLYTLTLNPKP